ncbi:hypothetical protein ACFPK6_04285 [Dokdonella soli]
MAWVNIAGVLPGAFYSAWGVVDPSKPMPSHGVYDAFFDLRTDDNLARFMRNFAIRVGATITP